MGPGCMYAMQREGIRVKNNYVGLHACALTDHDGETLLTKLQQY